MAEVDKKVTEMTSAQSLTASDLFYLLIADQQSDTGFSSRKATASLISQAMLNTFEFPLLLTETQSDTIIGAINEIAQGGGTASILTGTSAPSSSLGENGNLYVQYTEGTGGASDVVDAMYVKLDGEWIEIATSGGSGIGTKLTGTLTAGTTSVSFSDASITTSSLIDVYTSTGIQPTAFTVSTGSLTLTFASQQSDVDVAVLIDARGSGAGGSTVSIIPSVSSGDKIADYDIDGTTGSLYAPKELPSVSSTDNFKVLGVNSGAWASMGLNSLLNINYTMVGTRGDTRLVFTQSGTTWSASKTLREVAQIFQKGGAILFPQINDANGYDYVGMYIGSVGNSGFAYGYFDLFNSKLVVLYIASSGTSTVVIEKSIALS